MNINQNNHGMHVIPKTNQQSYSDDQSNNYSEEDNTYPDYLINLGSFDVLKKKPEIEDSPYRMEQISTFHPLTQPQKRDATFINQFGSKNLSANNIQMRQPPDNGEHADDYEYLMDELKSAILYDANQRSLISSKKHIQAYQNTLSKNLKSHNSHTWSTELMALINSNTVLMPRLIYFLEQYNNDINNIEVEMMSISGNIDTLNIKKDQCESKIITVKQTLDEYRSNCKESEESLSEIKKLKTKEYNKKIDEDNVKRLVENINEQRQKIELLEQSLNELVATNKTTIDDMKRKGIEYNERVDKKNSNVAFRKFVSENKHLIDELSYYQARNQSRDHRKAHWAVFFEDSKLSPQVVLSYIDKAKHKNDFFSSIMAAYRKFKAENPSTVNNKCSSLTDDQKTFLNKLHEPVMTHGFSQIKHPGEAVTELQKWQKIVAERLEDANGLRYFLSADITRQGESKATGYCGKHEDSEESESNSVGLTKRSDRSYSDSRAGEILKNSLNRPSSSSYHVDQRPLSLCSSSQSVSQNPHELPKSNPNRVQRVLNQDHQRTSSDTQPNKGQHSIFDLPNSNYCIKEQPSSKETSPKKQSPLKDGPPNFFSEYDQISPNSSENIFQNNQLCLSDNSQNIFDQNQNNNESSYELIYNKSNNFLENSPGLRATDDGIGAITEIQKIPNWVGVGKNEDLETAWFSENEDNFKKIANAVSIDTLLHGVSDEHKSCFSVEEDKKIQLKKGTMNYLFSDATIRDRYLKVKNQLINTFPSLNTQTAMHVIFYIAFLNSATWCELQCNQMRAHNLYEQFYAVIDPNREQQLDYCTAIQPRPNHSSGLDGLTNDEVGVFLTTEYKQKLVELLNKS
jgi:hypothetical protein